jgi:endonuclease YncB( thermonuclease family)
MLILLLILSRASLASAADCTQPASPTTSTLADVMRVVGGETVVVRVVESGREGRIRMIGVDTPARVPLASLTTA